MSDDTNIRLQVLEEKFAHQERLVDALNEVIIEQQLQLRTIEEQFSRFRALLEAMHDRPPGGQDPPPPHY
ncbi:MAG: SlyX family protein [Proteobacteria bacterium]|nr:SlyX family protein [Pseudomonadota bacterium]